MVRCFYRNLWAMSFMRLLLVCDFYTVRHQRNRDSKASPYSCLVLEARVDFVKKCIIATSFVLSGCTAEPETSFSEPSDDQHSNEWPNEVETKSDVFNLPTRTDSGNCGYPAPAPAFCEWGIAADDVVLMDVTSVEFFESPIVDLTTSQVINACEGVTNPGLVIVGDVVDSLKGRTEALTLHFGYLQHDEWNSAPYRSSDGSIAWTGDEKITPGTRLGVAYHRDTSSGCLSPLAEHFFAVTSDGAIRYADQEFDCEEPPPLGVEGNTFASLRIQLEDCTSSVDSEERVSSKEAIWGNPTFATLGGCFPNDGIPSSGCRTDSECGIEQACEMGFCVDR